MLRLSSIPASSSTRDARLAAAIDALLAHQAAVRVALRRVAAGRPQLDAAGEAALDHVEAAVASALARETRVIVPALRALVDGAPGAGPLASTATLARAMAADHRAAIIAIAALTAQVLDAPAGGDHAAMAVDAERLTAVLAAHHQLTMATVLPLAHARERAVGP